MDYDDLYIDLDISLPTEITTGEPPPTWTPYGWAFLANKVLASRGKTLRDKRGRMNFPRRVMLSLSADTLQTMAAYGLQVDVTRIPWGSFAEEETTWDFEKDRELLRDWVESAD